MDELERCVPDELLARPAEHLRRRVVDIDEHREVVLALYRKARDDVGVGRVRGQLDVGVGDDDTDEHTVLDTEVEEVQMPALPAPHGDPRLRGAARPHAIPGIDDDDPVGGFDDIEHPPRPQDASRHPGRAISGTGTKRPRASIAATCLCELRAEQPA